MTEPVPDCPVRRGRGRVSGPCPVGAQRYRDRLRAQIVLAAAAGKTNAAIAVEMGVCTDTVRKWRRRFAGGRLAGLKDAPRSGRPPVFTAADRAEAVALACALPAETGVPLSRWSCPELARELAARCQVAASASTVAPVAGRRRAQTVAAPLVDLRPRPGLRGQGRPRAGPVCRHLGRRAAGRNDFVICADEKTSIQARCRCHPTLPPGKARAMRVEHDYKRGGALAYLAAWDVHRGQVTGRCEATTGIAPFSRLVEQVMTSRALRQRGPGVLDRGQRLLPPRRRLDQADGQAWPNAHLIHLPVHASWLDQAEIYFSVVQRKVLTPERLHRPRPDPRPPRRVRDPLQRHRQAVQLEVHPHRPQRPAGPHRRPRQDPARRPGSMNSTPDELTGATT